MKKVLLLTVLAVTLFVVQSCKKGEDDPFLSLKTRDSRIAGEWILKSQELTESETESYDGISETESNTLKYDGAIVTETFVSGGETEIYTYSYTKKIEIFKDGSYKTVETEDGSMYTSSGNWWWLNDSKKKTRIAFDDDYESFDIQMLKSNEMTWVVSQESTWSNPSGVSFTSVLKGNMTFVKI
jgi:hypothetical protein